jgi:hypothetical protein
MSQTSLSLTLLIDPTSSKNGKFYLGVEDDRYPVTVHGPASRGASGTWSKLDSAAAVRKKIQEKQRKAYRPATVSEIPQKVIDGLYDQVGQVLGLQPNSLAITNGFITIKGQGGSGGRTGGSPSRKPRRRNTQNIHVWI